GLYTIPYTSLFRSDLVKSRQNIDQGCFPRPRASHHSKRISGIHFKVDIPEYIVFTVVTKKNILKLNLADHFIYGQITFIFDVVRAIDQIENTLPCHDAHLKYIELISQHPHWSKQHIEENGKNHQATKSHSAAQDAFCSPPYQQGQR